MKNTREYDDIINLSRPKSKHPHMARSDRAAQFSPFAALTGYDDAVKETGRITDERTELDENEIELINEKLQFLSENKDAAVSVTYFKPDEKKSGGEYLTVTGTVKKIDPYKQTIVMTDNAEIPIQEIRDIELK